MSTPTSFASAPTLARTAERHYLRLVFAWMFLALGVTTAVAVWFHASASTSDYFAQHQGLFWVAIAAQLAMVFALSAALNKLSVPIAATMFLLYAALTGFVFSILLDVYSTASVAGAFAGAAGVFAGMASYGYLTERDLSGLGGILFGALIGLIAASIAFVFIGGSTLNLVIGFAGVIIFSVFTAYDIQNIKRLAAGGFAGEAMEEKAAIHGALRLYLDFINLFISLLRIFGNSR
ncbi:MAG: Bax inhibitor-1/YccA family protein [Solirubrobacteraceae bacterium]